MRRRYTVEKFADRIAAVKRAMPDAFIGIDVITGFPGETDEDFEETLDIARRVEYDSAFTFIYSPREGTPAAKFTDQIPDEICHERFDRLVDVMNEISLRKNQAYKGRVCEVIAEGLSRSDDKVLSGRTDGFKLVNFTTDKSPETLMGRKVKVEITESKTFSLEGREVE
jgi:tRNA-2-methylthio-N6-dimethylallyladenosine synthase